MKKFIILVLFGSMLNVLEAQNDSIKVCPYFWKDNTPMQIENISVGMATQTGTFPIIYFSTFSEPDGCAEFPLAPLDPASEFFFSGGKADNTSAGISILDLVLISEHILGIAPLASPASMIAADFNRSGSITTFDIVQIRKVLLGIEQGPADFGFIQKQCNFGNNPFNFNCDLYSKQELEQIGEVEMVGWKKGDVDGDYLGLKPPVDTTTIIFPNMMLTAGVPVTIPVKTSAFNSLAFQIGLTLDTMAVVVDSITGDDMYPSLWNVKNEEARITLLSNVLDPIEQGTIFYLHVTPTANIALKDAISLSTQFSTMFVPNTDSQNYWTSKLVFSSNVSQQETPAAAAQQVKVSPNPFSAQSQLIFDLPQSGTVQVAITDLTGRRTYETTLTLSAGKQVIDIPGSVLPAGSIGIYSLTTQAGSVSGKIVKN